MVDIPSILDSIQESNVYFYLQSDPVDWTINSGIVFVIHSNNKIYNIELSDLKDIEIFAASFGFYVRKSNLLCWNLKNIITFFRKKVSINLELSNVYDLSILCSYFNLPKNKPVSSKEAFYIFNYLLKTKTWNDFDKFYKSVFSPLISKTIPKIETNCLVHVEEKKLVYSYYEIEGQSNGRLKNIKILKDSFMPHSMGEKEKEKLRLTNDNQYFLYFDYKYMEVSTLEWITKDKKLTQILNSDTDLYEGIWKEITGTEAGPTQRKLCKKIFLPVLFGQKSWSLSKQLGIEEKNASKLIYRLERAFPVAFTWIKSQLSDSNNVATDIFGRRRKFQEDELYKIRNFCIQSPSNMICLRKLVKLDEILDNKAKICFHIHDGYAISCNKKDLRNIFEISKKTLEEDDDLFPSLHLKTSCHFGENLNNLKNIKEVINESHSKLIPSH